MTMTKFEPVAFVQSDPDGHLHLAEITKTEACQNLDQWDRQVGWKAVPLHTADQLTEAYEAGKREASEDIEQAAFEKWLYDKCPSGDVESVQRQWLESYEYAELAGKMEQAAQINHLQMALADTEALEAETSARCLNQAAQIEMMREFIARAPVSSGVCCCGEAIDRHSSPMICGHSPVDLWDHSVEQILSTTPDQALEWFAAKVREQCDFECYKSNEYGFHRTYLDISNAIRAIKELPK